MSLGGIRRLGRLMSILWFAERLFSSRAAGSKGVPSVSRLAALPDKRVHLDDAKKGDRCRSRKNPEWRAHSIQVLTIQGGSIAVLTKFLSPPLFRAFGLPAVLPNRDAPANCGVADVPLLTHSHMRI